MLNKVILALHIIVFIVVSYILGGRMPESVGGEPLRAPLPHNL